MIVIAIFMLGLGFLVYKTFIIVPKNENVIKERFGKFRDVLMPGFHFLIPFVDSAAYRHEVREQVFDIPSQNCITKDNLQVEVDGIVYLKVMDAKKASYGISNYKNACINLAQTTMRSEIGKLSLDQAFSERDNVNENIVKEIDTASDPWGIKVFRYEIQNLNPSPKLIEVLEQQMEAERQKRADITLANAEKEATIQLSQAQRQQAINLSEGERQKQINEAEGKAKEIELITEATVNGLRKISESISKPGGKKAAELRIVEQYIKEFAKITSKAKVSVIPTDIAKVHGFFDGLGEISKNLDQKGV